MDRVNLGWLSIVGLGFFFSAGVCCLSGHVMWLVVGVYSHSFAGFSAFGDNVTCLSSRRDSYGSLVVDVLSGLVD